MGNAKKMICNMCGFKWLNYEGIGLQKIEIVNDTKRRGEINEAETKCPKCGSTDVEADRNIQMLWD